MTQNPCQDGQLTQVLAYQHQQEKEWLSSQAPDQTVNWGVFQIWWLYLGAAFENEPPVELGQI